MATSKFEKLSSSIQKKQGIGKERANAITASIGRKKYGKEAFQKMAVAGKKKSK
jgi:hypothetical protein